MNQAESKFDFYEVGGRCNGTDLARVLQNETFVDILSNFCTTSVYHDAAGALDASDNKPQLWPQCPHAADTMPDVRPGPLQLLKTYKNTIETGNEFKKNKHTEKKIQGL